MTCPVLQVRLISSLLIIVPSRDLRYAKRVPGQAVEDLVVFEVMLTFRVVPSQVPWSRVELKASRSLWWRIFNLPTPSIEDHEATGQQSELPIEVRRRI